MGKVETIRKNEAAGKNMTGLERVLAAARYNPHPVTGLLTMLVLSFLQVHLFSLKFISLSAPHRQSQNIFSEPEPYPQL
jgi:hypothetical protein